MFNSKLLVYNSFRTFPYTFTYVLLVHAVPPEGRLSSSCRGKPRDTFRSWSLKFW